MGFPTFYALVIDKKLIALSIFIKTHAYDIYRVIYFAFIIILVLVLVVAIFVYAIGI